MYAPYLPASASEFPNDNPALHEGARWVCQRPGGPPRAVLRAAPCEAATALVPAALAPSAPASEWSAVAAPLQQWSALAPVARADTHQPALNVAAPNEPTIEREPFAREPDAPPPSQVLRTARSEGASTELPAAEHELPAVLKGPLQLDLSRIVLPHRVANVPPPPAFIFRPLPSSRRAAAAAASALAAPPLTPLGFRVVDRYDARQRVQRLWRVDVAPCLQVAGSPAELAAVMPAAAAAPTVAEVAATAAASELPASLALPVVEAPASEPLAAVPALAPLPAPLPDEPPTPLHSGAGPASGRRRKPEPAPAAEGGNKKQRRRAVRVTSNSSLVTAALPGNEELSRTLSQLEAEFSERRVEQPASSRKRRSRRAAAASNARPRRAANAV